MIIDSNIIIYSAMPEYQKLRGFLSQNANDLVVSAITKLEVLGYHKISTEEKSFFEGFFQTIIVHPVNFAIIEKAILLRQKQKMTLGDSLIAATSISLNQKLLTNNVEDFAGLGELIVIPMQSIL